MKGGHGAAEVLPIVTAAQFAEAVRRAVELLRAGEVAALPTETVYGLAANALDPAAVARIFEIKGRPSHNPIIVHVDGLEMARRCAAAWTEAADRLAGAFWPGPLTLVLAKAPGISDIVTAGGSTVGLRWPSHPFMQEVIRVCGFPLAAPSANPSNQVSPTTAEHVRRWMGGKLRLIVDGGACHVGIESTVVDVSARPARLLRPGMVGADQLRAVVVDLLELPGAPRAGAALRSPGLLPKHYAPRAPLLVGRWQNEEGLQALIAGRGAERGKTHVMAHAQVPLQPGYGRVCILPRQPAALARMLYRELHRCDEAEAGLIVVEELPETPCWQALRDRLRRAAS